MTLAALRDLGSKQTEMEKWTFLTLLWLALVANVIDNKQKIMYIIIYVSHI